MQELPWRSNLPPWLPCILQSSRENPEFVVLCHAACFEVATMRSAAILLFISCTLTPSKAQQVNEGPTSDKAKKTYNQGLEYLSKHQHGLALDSFKKADKQDGGHCTECQRKILKYAVELRDWKAAEAAGEQLVDSAQGNKNLAIAHYSLGVVWMSEASSRKKDELYSRA